MHMYRARSSAELNHTHVCVHLLQCAVPAPGLKKINVKYVHTNAEFYDVIG